MPFILFNRPSVKFPNRTYIFVAALAKTENGITITGDKGYIYDMEIDYYLNDVILTDAISKIVVEGTTVENAKKKFNHKLDSLNLS